MDGMVKARGFMQYSDIRLKTDVEDIVDAIQLISKLQGKRYRWKPEEIAKVNKKKRLRNKLTGGWMDGAHDEEFGEDGYGSETDDEEEDRGEKVIGLIAQEVQKILPEVVQEDEEGYLTVAYSEIIPVLINAFNQHMEDYHREQQYLRGKFDDFEQDLKRMGDHKYNLQSLINDKDDLQRLAEEMKDMVPSTPYSKLVKRMRRQRRADRRRRHALFLCLVLSFLLSLTFTVIIAFVTPWPWVEFYTPADTTPTAYVTSNENPPAALRTWQVVNGGSLLSVVGLQVDPGASSSSKRSVSVRSTAEADMLRVDFEQGGTALLRATLYHQIPKRKDSNEQEEDDGDERTASTGAATTATGNGATGTGLPTSTGAAATGAGTGTGNGATGSGPNLDSSCSIPQPAIPGKLRSVAFVYELLAVVEYRESNGVAGYQHGADQAMTVYCSDDCSFTASGSPTFVTGNMGSWTQEYSNDTLVPLQIFTSESDDQVFSVAGTVVNSPTYDQQGNPLDPNFVKLEFRLNDFPFSSSANNIALVGNLWLDAKGRQNFYPHQLLLTVTEPSNKQTRGVMRWTSIAGGDAYRTVVSRVGTTQAERQLSLPCMVGTGVTFSFLGQSSDLYLWGPSLGTQYTT